MGWLYRYFCPLHHVTTKIILLCISGTNIRTISIFIFRYWFLVCGLGMLESENELVLIIDQWPIGLGTFVPNPRHGLWLPVAALHTGHMDRYSVVIPNKRVITPSSTISSSSTPRLKLCWHSSSAPNRNSEPTINLLTA